MLAIKQMIRKVAKTDVPVFITGESGVGKEVVAQAIWKNSRRADKPCISINCAAIPSDLIESELFGYEEGAFTGAKRSGKKDYLRKPMAEPSFWMKLVSCLIISSQNCFVFLRL